MTSVLAALDDSPTARLVMDTAIAIAPCWDADVIALHVGDGTGGIAHQVAASAAISLQERSGDVVDQLLEAVRDDLVIAVVVGARGRRGGRVPAGHVAEELLRRCDKPVVVVPPDAPAVRVVRRMLVALEGDEICSEMLAPLFGWARTRDIEIVAVHVDDETNLPRFSDQLQHETSAFVAEFLARHAPTGVHDAQLELRIGAPAEQALAVADDCGADLLAVSWSRHLEPGRARFVTYVLEHSRIPVLLVPTTRVRQSAN